MEKEISLDEIVEKISGEVNIANVKRAIKEIAGTETKEFNRTGRVHLNHRATKVVMPAETGSEYYEAYLNVTCRFVPDTSKPFDMTGYKSASQILITEKSRWNFAETLVDVVEYSKGAYVLEVGNNSGDSGNRYSTFKKYVRQ